MVNGRTVLVLWKQTPLPGVYILHLETKTDARGWFARTWCDDEATEHGIDVRWVQCSTSFNQRRGTLHGSHYQREPGAEVKLVWCVRGSTWDITVDLRLALPTYGAWVSVVLPSDGKVQIFIPPGCARGFQTIEDDTELFYQTSARYRPEPSEGIDWKDRNLAVEWPLPDEAIVSERDQHLPEWMPCPQLSY
jgi:dTDP-4-dehydrorhamnose 3,5-epimerase